ncbi:unannotated protein [freshwater metagenome]|uniref:Unannotated protein n=1 Tax=freshwater metagenome TaxID=449393 RepID=A0A6J6M1B0_9ZZZZ
MCCHLFGVITPEAEIIETPFTQANICPALVCSIHQPLLAVFRERIEAKLVDCVAAGLIQASTVIVFEFHAALSGTTIREAVPLNDAANWLVANGEKFVAPPKVTDVGTPLAPALP